MYALRRAVPADAEPMVAVTSEGFATYRSFAPEGWSPPSAAEELERLRVLLPDPDVWYLVAEDVGAVVGHVGFLPATRSRWGSGDASLAHFRQLFVTRTHWGTGLATMLHRAAVEEAMRRGFTAMRLYTPAQQARARRFYEREGWAVVAGSDAPGLNGLEIVEYRRSLLE
jgi:GNAT superfamily N-acetyltransferase